MNPEVKAKWVAALRSGKFTQGRSALKTVDGGYCCLGVLCEINGDLTEDGYVENDTEEDETGTSASYPPAGYQGLTHTEIRHLGRMNDLYRATFAQIADYAEAKL